MQPSEHRSIASLPVALAIAQTCPDALFCGFKTYPKPDGSTAKLPVSKTGKGVGADIDRADLIHASQVGPDALTSEANYWGVYLQKFQAFDPFGELVLTILDLDTKRSDAPKDVRMERLMAQARKMGLLTERSHSKKGGHIIFLAPSDPSLPAKIDLGNRQEIEIFGHPKSAGKNVMLTGDSVKGAIIELGMSVAEFLAQAGISVLENSASISEPTFPAIPTSPQHLRNDLSAAQAALRYINLSEGDYSEWIAIGMAMQAGFGDAGFGAWLDWSASQPGFKGEKDCWQHWKSFSPDSGIGLGTLFHKAAQNGYRLASKALERKTAIEDFGRFIEQQQQEPQQAQQPQQPTQGWDEVDYDLSALQPIDYLIDGFLAHSFSVIAGQPGVGKTTAMLSIALIASGFTLGDCTFKAEARRKIIYVSEDTSQIKRSLFAYCKHLGLDSNEVKQWFVMVESRRSDVAQVLELGHNVVRHTINGERPWLVIDTANATLDIENENDNSEVGAYMAALKQTIYTQLGASITIVTHTSKTISREDDAAMARGASAFTGDATLTAVLFMDDEKNRYMRLVKTRYEPINREIKFNTSIYSEVVINRHGNMQDLQCVIVVPESSSEEGRKKIAADAREAKKNAAILDKCDEACSYVQSIINSCPEGVIVKRGKGGSHIPPSEFQGMTELTMNEICQAVPGSDTGPNRKAIADAVAARFAPIKVVGSWLQLS